MGKDDQLRRGGARVIREAGTVEIYSREGGRLVRETAAGLKTTVGPLLDKRTGLSDRQRAVGQTYGAFYQDITTGGGGAWLKERVDSSSGTPTGVAESTMHKLAMVELARKSLMSQAALVYPLRRTRGGGQRGSHQSITMVNLVDRICVEGETITVVAFSHQWWAKRLFKNMAGRKVLGKAMVPDRQRGMISKALATALDSIDDAWSERGYDVPFDAAGLSVR